MRNQRELCSIFAHLPLVLTRDTRAARGGMTDIFFSYSSADRERVRPIRDALVYQQVPASSRHLGAQSHGR
jgi:hypothetical protein